MEQRTLIINTENMCIQNEELPMVIETLRNLNIAYTEVKDDEDMIDSIKIVKDNAASAMWDIIENLDDKYEFQIGACEGGFILYPHREI